MIILKETALEGLIGVIDGVNRTYRVHVDFNPDTVNVYVNGLLKVREWDDGFVVQSPRTVILNEPLVEGDSLEIEFQTDAKTGGGALGGVPEPPQLEELVPRLEVDAPPVPKFTIEQAPSVSLEAEPLAGVSVGVDALRPRILDSAFKKEC